MITVRIAHAEYRPGTARAGTFRVDRVLVVLADDAGGRALPIWLPAMDGYSIRVLLDRPARSAVMAPVPEELASRLLRAAGSTVTAVDIEELGPEATAARIELNTPSGPRQVMGRLADGLAMAAAAGAPVRVAGPVMDRLAVQVRGDDLLGPFLEREPAAAEYHVPRRKPRNLAFTEGLDGNFLRDASGSHWQDYSCTTEGHAAILSSSVPHPYESAQLSQEIRADHYRGCTVVFRGELRAEDIGGQARLYLRVRAGQPARASHEQHSATVAGSHGWATHEVSAPVPEGAISVQFGVTLSGRGRIGLRNASLTRRHAEASHARQPLLLVNEAVGVRWLAASGR
jgi:bifunctional DNase/RNase